MQRRQFLVRTAILVVRAIALAVMIAVAWAGWAARHGPRVDGSVIFVIALALIAMALYFSWRYRPDLRDTARMLDRSFSLSDRISTAVDHLDARADKSNGKPHVAYLQIAEATNTVAILSKHPALRVRPPIREVVLVAAAALLFLSLYLVRGTGAGLPGAGNPAVPAFVSARDRLQQQPVQPNQPADTSENAPTIEDVQKRADDSASATEDLLTLADALDDNPLTAPIADAIRAGDYESAAAQLNAVASQVSQLSPEIRNDLADQLDKAADAMTGAHPDLQDATGNAADGLRSDPQTAESSLNDLSEQISATGKAVESQQDLANDMRDARQAGQSGSQHEDTRPEPGASQSDPGSGRAADRQAMAVTRPAGKTISRSRDSRPAVPAPAIHLDSRTVAINHRKADPVNRRAKRVAAAHPANPAIRLAIHPRRQAGALRRAGIIRRRAIPAVRRKTRALVPGRGRDRAGRRGSVVERRRAAAGHR